MTLKQGPAWPGEARHGKSQGRAAGANPWDGSSLECLRNGKQDSVAVAAEQQGGGVGKVNSILTRKAIAMATVVAENKARSWWQGGVWWAVTRLRLLHPQ